MGSGPVEAGANPHPRTPNRFQRQNVVARMHQTSLAGTKGAAACMAGRDVSVGALLDAAALCGSCSGTQLCGGQTRPIYRGGRYSTVDVDDGDGDGEEGVRVYEGARLWLDLSEAALF